MSLLIKSNELIYAPFFCLWMLIYAIPETSEVNFGQWEKRNGKNLDFWQYHHVIELINLLISYVRWAQKILSWEFLGGLVVSIRHFHCCSELRPQVKLLYALVQKNKLNKTKKLKKKNPSYLSYLWLSFQLLVSQSCTQKYIIFPCLEPSILKNFFLSSHIVSWQSYVMTSTVILLSH